ncbi:MAG: hypothetical protein GY874_18500 [Desulfobacteraceae bacterium]|nr:hypothetical protein [Desulfobacteraceae bacterium]
MDQTIIDKLLKLCNSNESDELITLKNAVSKKFTAYKKDDCKKNLAEWDAAQKALEEKVNSLSTIYLAEEKRPRLKNRSAAAKFLEDLGYKIKKSNFYNHAKQGLIKVDADGSVDESEVRAYAQRQGLKKIRFDKDDGKFDDIHREKLEQEVARLKKQNEKLDHEMNVAKERFLERGDVVTQFAIKWSTVQGSIKNLIQSSALDWITAVGGKPKKRDTLINLCFSQVEDVFNQLAEIKDLKIVLKRQPSE